MKRALSLGLAAFMLLSSSTTVLAAPAKTGKNIAGYGSANYQSILDYKSETEQLINTDSDYREKLPSLDKRDTSSNIREMKGIVTPVADTGVEAPLDVLISDPFSDLYFDKVFAGPTDDEFSWMVENNVLSRDNEVTMGRNGIIVEKQFPLFDRNQLNTPAKKSDFLVCLYKSLFGPISSRPIVFQADAIRNARKITYEWVKTEDGGYWQTVTGSTQSQMTSSIGKKDIITSTFVDYWEYDYTPYSGAPTGYYINKNGDILYYLNPNVYELYLAAMLDKNLIRREEISDTAFLAEYNDIMKKSGSKPTLPEWYTQIGPFMATKGPEQVVVNYTPSSSGNYLGKRYTLSGVGSETVSVKFNDNVNYFMQENISTMTALRYIEKFLRVTEEDLTDAEAQIIAYKYGVSYLADYTEDERRTIMFLVAKGIIDFENPDEYRNLYGSLTEDYMYTLIYRLARPDARRKFHEIQLTDTDNFWIDRGYQASNYVLKKENDTRKVRLVEDGSYIAMPVPNVETLSVTGGSGTGRARVEDDGLVASTVYSNFYADDSENLQTFTIVKEFDNLKKYRFNGKEFDGNNVVGDIDPYIKVSRISGNTVTFTVQAQTDVIALAAVDSKIQVATDSVYDDYSLRSVTKISANGEETTLVHQSTFQEADSEIMLLEDKVLKNKVTGATAVLLPDQGMALVGSHVIVSDDIMVTSVNGEVYYNLDVIVTLMSNAYMSDINPFDIYQVKSMYTEQSIPLVSPSGSNVGDVLALTMENPKYTGTETDIVAGLKKSKGFSLKLVDTVVSSLKNLFSSSSSKDAVVSELMQTLATAQHSMSSGGESADVSQIPGFNFVNLSQAMEGSNHLIRDFEISTYENKTVKYKMILYFTYEVPNIDFDFENPDVFGSNPTLEDFNKLMTERPKDRALAEYWDNNLELSNAFANVIYGTSGVKYVKNGYLMPHVRILYQDNALLDDDVLYDLMVKVGSEFSGEFVDTFLGTAKYNEKVSSSNPSDTSGVYYPAKELPQNILPLWVHALFNNKQEPMTGGTNSFVVSNEPKSGRANTQLWRYMMSERSFSYMKPMFSAASLNVYVFNDDVFLVTDSNIVYKLDSENSKIMPGVLENNGYHMRSRTAQTMKELEKLIGTIVTFDNGNGQVSSFYFEGISGNHLVLVDTAYVEGKPRIASGGKRMKYIEVDGNVVYPTGDKSSSSSTQFSERCNSLAAVFNGVSKMNSVMDWGSVGDVTGLPHETQIPEGVYVVGRPNGMKDLDSPLFKRYKANGEQGESLSVNSLGSEEVRAHVRVFVNSNHFKIDPNGMIYFNSSPSLYSAGNIYFSSLNKGLMDSMIAKGTDVVSVNDLLDGQRLIFTDSVLVKNGDWFYSEPQYNVQSWEELVKAYDDPEKQKEAVWRYFAGTIIDTSRVQVSLSAFIKDAGLGRIKPGITPDSTLVGSATSENEALIFEADGSSEVYAGFSETNLPKSVSFKVLLNDSLLCRLIDEESQTYELLYATNALSEGYLDDIPFFDESLSLSAKDDLFYRLNLNDFKVSYMASELKQRFLENYREARAGEVKELLQFLIAVLAVVYTFFLWMAWVIVDAGIGKGILMALKYPTNGGRSGIDLVRIITLGTFDLESDVKAGRIILTTMALMILAMFLTMF